MNEIGKPVIGLEVHVELKTKSKMFCGCPADHFAKKPNTQTCPVCLGLPGALPVPNQQAIEWCVMLGKALNCETLLFSKFDRKNYFYPDLPKGYQISQYDQPFCQKGWIEVNGKKIGITRVHMEEDTGKLIHEGGSTLVDFNRSGVPLVEIVTDPDFDNAKDVKAYLQKLQQIVRYLEISDGDLEKGQMRLEPNISITGTKKPYKVEVKNINSFSFVDKAINYELKRQQEIIEKGETPVQETRGWEETAGITKTQRIKEEAQDYRYFPEPDIPPIRWTNEQLRKIESQIPELPDAKLIRFKKEYQLMEYDAEILTRDTLMANYFEETVKVGVKENISPKQIANYIINRKVNITEVLPAKVIGNILQTKNIVQIDEKELSKVIEEILKSNEKAVSDFRKGKENAIMFLVGQVMRQFKQKVDASVIKASLLAKLEKWQTK
ncbi:MAG TPA: Asp-tRNA(Asn)/Glu-tRNA(Gln) amidotransferase subunit GatB [Patescibacteria group bacterium]|nr:Asp-tRNA(Asn)/Glu-tRNA(Gln) amidotransferase subunit GatB [Patescibacteria group bacterium]